MEEPIIWNKVKFKDVENKKYSQLQLVKEGLISTQPLSPYRYRFRVNSACKAGSPGEIGLACLDRKWFLALGGALGYKTPVPTTARLSPS